MSRTLGSAEDLERLIATRAREEDNVWERAAEKHRRQSDQVRAVNRRAWQCWFQLQADRYHELAVEAQEMADELKRAG